VILPTAGAVGKAAVSKRDLHSPLEPLSEALWSPLANTLTRGHSHGVQVDRAGTRAKHEISQHGRVIGRESEAIHSFADQVWHATASIRDEHGQASRHRFIHDKPPLVLPRRMEKTLARP
jgi:hypothetical protein